jgi:hypothetical protein
MHTHMPILTNDLTNDRAGRGRGKHDVFGVHAGDFKTGHTGVISHLHT